MYAALGTRPDIMFTVTFLSQFMQNPGCTHWEEVKHVFRYLKGTADWKLTIGVGGHWNWAEEGRQDRISLEGFLDVDGASQYHRYCYKPMRLSPSGFGPSFLEQSRLV
jgi:hypothetical protein